MVDPQLPDLGLSPQTYAYEGPLTTFVALDRGTTLHAKADLRFEPMPDEVDVTYSSGATDHHFTYAHTSTGEVDLAADVVAKIPAGLESPSIDLTAHADIDRLPRQAAIDLDGALESGGLRLATTTSNGRLPDVAADVRARVGLIVVDGHVDVESIPSRISLDWEVPEGGAPSAVFETNGQGVGALEADVTAMWTPNTASGFKPPRFVPTERQYLAAFVGTGGFSQHGAIRLQARLQRIRGATFEVLEDGTLQANAQVGDGEHPLEVHGDLDLRADGLPRVEATATLAPLPDDITIAVRLPDADDTEVKPITVDYEGSETVDIHATARLVFPSVAIGDPGCGELDVICADLDMLHIPTRDLGRARHRRPVGQRLGRCRSGRRWRTD